MRNKMSNGRKQIDEGYQPQKEKRGYQPHVDIPNDPRPESGYTPTGEGDNPSNPPQPPAEE
jgi:hypothetical protein